jgi:hypothetical protein
MIIASTDGYFAGNVRRGERLTVFVPEGTHTFVAWNPVMEQKVFPPHPPRPADVAVLRASALSGRAYYARLSFGDWDEQGPRTIPWRPDPRVLPASRCYGSVPAFVRVDGSAERDYEDLPEWVGELRPVAPDLAGGQAWLVENREDWELHKGLGEARFRKLSPLAKQLATVSARGVAISLSGPTP